VLVPFGDVAALGRDTAALLSDGPRRLAMRQRAYAQGRSTIWPRIAERYCALLESIGGGARCRHPPRKFHGPVHPLHAPATPIRGIICSGFKGSGSSTSELRVRSNPGPQTRTQRSYTSEAPAWLPPLSTSPSS